MFRYMSPNDKSEAPPTQLPCECHDLTPKRNFFIARSASRKYTYSILFFVGRESGKRRLADVCLWLLKVLKAIIEVGW